jgi:ribosomal protein S18 acetylase RimI-like enzyme
VAEIREATWADLDAVVDLLDTRSRAAFGISEVQAAEVRHAWELPGRGPGWVATDNELIVGYASLDSTHDAVIAAAEPEDGDALLARVERRACERRFDHLTVIVIREDRPLHELVQRSGFELDRETLRMWRALGAEVPAPRWPEGATVRSYGDADGEPVHELLDTSYADWDLQYVTRKHDDWLTFMTKHDDFDPELWFLVERDGELVACALNWRESQGRGWVKDIAVRQRERGQGLGAALLQHACHVYAKRGVTRVGLKVDSTNPTGALHLYEGAGFVTDQRYGIWIKRL